MKTFALTFYLVFVVIDAWAQASYRPEKEIFEVLSQNTRNDVTSAEFFQTAPAETAWKNFVFLYYNIRDSENVTKKAGLAIAENPQVEEYVTEGMTKLPYDYNNMNERGAFLRPLGYVPAPWSLRLLGHYLMDGTPMITHEPLPDYDTFENSEFAIIGLKRMGFFDAPRQDRPDGITAATTKAWREWWKANEGRVEQRIAEINPGYHIPTPLPKSPAPTLTPLIIGEYAATPAITSKPTAIPLTSATPIPPPATNRTTLSIYLCGSLIALGALAAIMWAFRRRN